MTRERSIEIVISTASESYRSVGHETFSWDLDNDEFDAFYVPNLRRVETIFNGEKLDKHCFDSFLELRSKGLEIWVLVPLPQMGQAHSSYKGFADFIQAWWWDENMSCIKFSHPETP